MSTIGLIKGRPQDDGRYRPISDSPAPVANVVKIESINDGRYRGSDDGKYRGGDDGRYTHDGDKNPPSPPPPPPPPTTTFRITTRATQPPTTAPPPVIRTTKIFESGKQWETIRLENDIAEDGYHYL